MRGAPRPAYVLAAMKPLIPTSLFCRGALWVALAASGIACSSEPEQNDACTPDDADGIIDEPATLLLTVSDTEFLPKVLAAQNTSEVTLIFRNDGTTPHSFVVDCKPTPNNDGCPTESCFPADSKIEPVPPGESVTIVFETPLVEGIYDFHSDVAEDAEFTPGQFIIL
jgi:hypothetical protein